jgi:16S rRNA (adenine1518-N6/adenine1519-N6)-dimethyltransferase
VIAVEKDRRFLPLLEELAAASDGALTVVEADALRVDEAALLGQHAPGLPLRIVSNLPYNVGTPLLVKWLSGPAPWEAMALMFQKEVARRIVASPGDADYGRLSVISQAVARVSLEMALPARAFTPPPKVESAVVGFTPREDRARGALLTALETVTQAAFGQRRKMLRSSLKPLGGEALCAAAGIDPNARAETVPVDGFLRMAQAVAAPA